MNNYELDANARSIGYAGAGHVKQFLKERCNRVWLVIEWIQYFSKTDGALACGKSAPKPEYGLPRTTSK